MGQEIREEERERVQSKVNMEVLKRPPWWWEYMCIRTISLLHGKLETDSTYRCPTYMSSTKVA